MKCIQMEDEANNLQLMRPHLTISGGFGKVVLGMDDGAGDNYGVD